MSSRTDLRAGGGAGQPTSLPRLQAVIVEPLARRIRNHGQGCPCQCACEGVLIRRVQVPSRLTLPA